MYKHVLKSLSCIYNVMRRLVAIRAFDVNVATALQRMFEMYDWLTYISVALHVYTR